MSDLIEMQQEIREMECRITRMFNEFQTKWGVDIHHIVMDEYGRVIGKRFTQKQIKIEVLL